eukprot:gene17282-30893_t
MVAASFNLTDAEVNAEYDRVENSLLGFRERQWTGGVSANAVTVTPAPITVVNPIAAAIGGLRGRAVARAKANPTLAQLCEYCGCGIATRNCTRCNSAQVLCDLCCTQLSELASKLQLIETIKPCTTAASGEPNWWHVCSADAQGSPSAGGSLPPQYTPPSPLLFDTPPPSATGPAGELDDASPINDAIDPRPVNPQLSTSWDDPVQQVPALATRAGTGIPNPTLINTLGQQHNRAPGYILTKACIPAEGRARLNNSDESTVVPAGLSRAVDILGTNVGLVFDRCAQNEALHGSKDYMFDFAQGSLSSPEKVFPLSVDDGDARGTQYDYAHFLKTYNGGNQLPFPGVNPNAPSTSSWKGNSESVPGMGARQVHMDGLEAVVNAVNLFAEATHAVIPSHKDAGRPTYDKGAKKGSLPTGFVDYGITTKGSKYPRVPEGFDRKCFVYLADVYNCKVRVYFKNESAREAWKEWFWYMTLQHRPDAAERPYGVYKRDYPMSVVIHRVNISGQMLSQILDGIVHNGVFGADDGLNIDDFVYVMSGAGMQMGWDQYLDKIAPHRLPFKNGWVDMRYVLPTGRHLAWVGMDQKESDFEGSPSMHVHSKACTTFGNVKMSGLTMNGGAEVVVVIYDDKSRHVSSRSSKTKTGEGMPVITHYPRTDGHLRVVHERYRRLLPNLENVVRNGIVIEVTVFRPEVVRYAAGSEPGGLLDMLTAGADLFTEHLRFVYIRGDVVVALIDRLLSTIEDEDGERYGGDGLTGRTALHPGVILILSKALACVHSTAQLVGMATKYITRRLVTAKEAIERRRSQTITAAQRVQRGPAFKRAALVEYPEDSIVRWIIQHVEYRVSGKGLNLRVTAILKGATGQARTQHNQFNGDSVQEMAEMVDTFAADACARNKVPHKIEWVRAHLELVDDGGDEGGPADAGDNDSEDDGREDDVANDVDLEDADGIERRQRFSALLANLDGCTAEDFRAIAAALVGNPPHGRHLCMEVMKKHFFPDKRGTQDYPGLVNLSNNCWLNALVVAIGSSFPGLVPLMMDVQRHSAMQKTVRELGLLVFAWSYSGAQSLHTRRVVQMFADPHGFNYEYGEYHDASEVFERVIGVLRESCADFADRYLPSALTGSIAYCKRCGCCNPVLHPGFSACLQIGNGFDPRIIDGVEESLHVEGWHNTRRAEDTPHEGDRPLDSCTCDEKDTSVQGQLQFNSLSLSINMVLVVQRYIGVADGDGGYSIEKLNYAVAAGDVLMLRDWSRGGGKVAYRVRCAVISTMRGRHFEAMFQVDADDDSMQRADGSGVYHSNDRRCKQVNAGLRESLAQQQPGNTFMLFCTRIHDSMQPAGCDLETLQEYADEYLTAEGAALAERYSKGRGSAAASSTIVSTTASAAYIRSAVVVDESPEADEQPAVDHGPCVYCGKPVLLTQSRVQVEHDRFAHRNLRDCKDETDAAPDLLVGRTQPERALLDGPAARAPAPAAAAAAAAAPAPALPLARAAAIAPAPPLARAAAIAPASPLVRTAAPAAPNRPTVAASAAADTGEELSEYEMERRRNIELNNAALARLGLATGPAAIVAPVRVGARSGRRAAPRTESRRSGRLHPAAAAAAGGVDEGSDQQVGVQVRVAQPSPQAAPRPDHARSAHGVHRCFCLGGRGAAVQTRTPVAKWQGRVGR